MPDEAATGSAPNLLDRTALRRHAMAAAANFAAQAQVEIEDGDLALIAEFMIAVTLTSVHNSKSIAPLPRAVLAAARLIFRLDELRLARAEVRGERHLARRREARIGSRMCAARKRITGTATPSPTR
jgi:hypothetical protein